MDHKPTVITNVSLFSFFTLFVLLTIAATMTLTETIRALADDTETFLCQIGRPLAIPRVIVHDILSRELR